MRAASFATSLTVVDDSETATGAELILTTTAADTSITEAVATCSPACNNPAPSYTVVGPHVKITLAGLTPATKYEVSVDANTIKDNNENDAATAPPPASVCTSEESFFCFYIHLIMFIRIYRMKCHFVL